VVCKAMFGKDQLYIIILKQITNSKTLQCKNLKAFQIKLCTLGPCYNAVHFSTELDKKR
jgi:hypothetical protein